MKITKLKTLLGLATIFFISQGCTTGVETTNIEKSANTINVAKTVGRLPEFSF